MAILEILQFPDPRLQQVALPVDVVDHRIRSMLVDLYETMYAGNGIGLAAPQVGILYRIFVMDLSKKRNERVCVINPVILERAGEQCESEGCLSVEGFYEPVKRATSVKLKGLNAEGHPFELEATGLLAVCIQHEIDHLDGILFIQRLSRLKRNRIEKKIIAQQNSQ